MLAYAGYGRPLTPRTEHSDRGGLRVGTATTPVTITNLACDEDLREILNLDSVLLCPMLLVSSDPAEREALVRSMP